MLPPVVMVMLYRLYVLARGSLSSEARLRCWSSSIEERPKEHESGRNASNSGSGCVEYEDDAYKLDVSLCSHLPCIAIRRWLSVMNLSWAVHKPLLRRPINSEESSHGISIFHRASSSRKDERKLKNPECTIVH